MGYDPTAEVQEKGKLGPQLGSRVIKQKYRKKERDVIGGTIRKLDEVGLRWGLK